MKFSIIVPVCIGLAACGSAARAQDETTDAPQPAPTEAPISTGRPSFSGGTGTAGVGRVQIENGFSSTRNQGSGGDRITDFSETLIRTGLSSRAELRVSVPNYFSVNSGNSGFGDGALAFRYRFYNDGKTTAAITPAITLAAGNRRFGSPNIDPTLTLAVGRKLSSRASLTGNLILRAPSKFGGRTNSGGSGDGSGGSGAGTGSSGVTSDSTNTSRNFTVIPAAVLSYSLTRKVGVFLDSYTIFPSRGATSSVVDSGVTYLLTNDVQLDASFGVGVGGNAPSNFVGAGLSFRF